MVGRTRAADAEASSYHCRKPGDMARKSGGLPAPVLAIPSWAVHAVGYRTADRLSGLFPKCYSVACRITRDAPYSDVALLARDGPLVAADARSPDAGPERPIRRESSGTLIGGRPISLDVIDRRSLCQMGAGALLACIEAS